MKYTFVVNPLSGSKDKIHIVEDITKNFPDCEILYTKYAGHASELAAGTESDVVVAVGGDGTVNEVARGLLGTEKILGIIPCGSGDGLALHLGMSRNHKKAIQQIKNAKIARMDHGTMNGRPFFCTAGVGFDAKIGMEFSKSGSRGLATYVRLSARNWFNYQPEHYKICLDGQPAWEGRAVLVTVGNANQWGNNAKICGEASLMDGLFDITRVKPFHTSMFPSLLVRLVRGNEKGCSKILTLRGRSVSIERDADGPAHFDGEPLQEGKLINMEMRASSLNVLIP